MQSAQSFMNNPFSTLIPSNNALPADPYPEHMVAGTMPPNMPWTPYILWRRFDTGGLPPIESVYNRSFITLTTP